MAQTWLETCWLSGSNSHNNTLSAHPLQPLWGFLTIDLDLDDSACTSRAFMGKVSIRIQKSMQNAAVDWCVQSYRVTRQHKAHMSHAAMPLAIDKCDSFFVVISVGWAWRGILRVQVFLGKWRQVVSDWKVLWVQVSVSICQRLSLSHQSLGAMAAVAKRDKLGRINSNWQRLENEKTQIQASAMVVVEALDPMDRTQKGSWAVSCFCCLYFGKWWLVVGQPGRTVAQ